jgi:FkbM family methyltransferase
MSVLHRWRKVRELSTAARKLHQLMREPYYQVLEVIHRRGVPIRLADGMPTRLHPRLLGMQPELYEPAVTSLLVHHLHYGATAVDVGAHVGLHSLMMSRLVGPEGRVIAVEPSPANANLLRMHLAWNGCANVSVIEAIAGNHEGDIEFEYRAQATDPGSFANSLAYNIGGPRRRVTMTTLDSLCNRCLPNLVKIDVEGAELTVLEGAEQVLIRGAPILVVSVHPAPLSKMGAKPADLVAFLEARGYCGHHLDGRPVTDPGFEEIVFAKEMAK